MEKKQTPVNNSNKNSNDNINNEQEKKIILSNIINKAFKCSQQTVTLTGGFIESIVSLNKPRLQKLCEEGLPDDLPILRSLIWKINFGYLPINSEEWDKTLKTQRDNYHYFKKLFTEKLTNELKLFEGYEKMSKEKISELEKKTNKVLLEEICKDVNRTHTQMSFFFSPINENDKFSQKEVLEMIESRRNCNLKNINETYKINIIETHADVIARILFIYSKFSPDLSYVQGMNEIIAPIYYCFSFDKLYKTENINDIEADTFWSFYHLMDHLKNVFNREKDETDYGLSGKTKRLKEMLKVIDNQLYTHLEKYGLDFYMFAYRWFILFFSQEFLMIDILRLWDYIFAKEDKFQNAYYVALAILLMEKDELLVSDLSRMIEILQKLKNLSIEEILGNAKYIQQNCGEKCLEIMNSSF